MKIRRGCLFFLFIFIFVFINSTKVNAVNTGFITNQMSSKEENTFVSNINILPIDKEPIRKTITCFDVNSNHLIAIGQHTTGRKKTICVYSKDGLFQYGYTFNCTGNFGIEWDKENINIYFVRSSAIVSVTPTGEVLDVSEVQNSIENNSYINHFIHATKRSVGNDEYIMRSNLGLLNIFATSYSQIIVKDSTGVENVIYDVSSKHLSSMIVTTVITCLFVLSVIVPIVWQFIKLKHLKKT